MPVQTQERKPLAVKVCKKCNTKLDALNKTFVCRNSQACNERIKTRFAVQTKEASTKPCMDLSFKIVLDALCEHFKYDEAKKKTFLSHALIKEFQRPRHVLAYLLINDLHLTHEDAATYYDRDRKTVSVGIQEVNANPVEYAHDIEAIRKICHAKVGAESAKNT